MTIYIPVCRCFCEKYLHLSDVPVYLLKSLLQLRQQINCFVVVSVPEKKTANDNKVIVLHVTYFMLHFSQNNAAYSVSQNKTKY